MVIDWYWPSVYKYGVLHINHPLPCHRPTCALSGGATHTFSIRNQSVHQYRSTQPHSTESTMTSVFAWVQARHLKVTERTKDSKVFACFCIVIEELWGCSYQLLSTILSLTFYIATLIAFPLFLTASMSSTFIHSNFDLLHQWYNFLRSSPTIWSRLFNR